MPSRYFDAVPRSYSPSRPLPSSSEGEQDQNEEAFDGEYTDKVFVSSNSQQQTFIPQSEVNTFKMTSEELAIMSLQNKSQGTLLSIPTGKSFAFIGACYLTVLRGSISLMGVCLHTSSRSYPIFSPRSDPLALIIALQYVPTEHTISLPNRIVKNTGETSLILIQSLKMNVESLGNYQILSQLFNPYENENNESISQCIGIDGLHFVNPSVSLKPPMHTFLLHDSWANALDLCISKFTSNNVSIAKPFVGLVKGPKNCGKSTFARSLLNTILTSYARVAFLECDVGQSEFTPGGMVSLHVLSMPVFGPSFTHPTIPFRAHYVGSSTPRSSPSQYLSFLRALLETYRTEIQNSYENLADGDNRIGSIVPLVVNTQGWIKGLGADLLQKIEEIVVPTAIFNFEGSQSSLGHSQQSAEVYYIQPILPSPSTQYFTATNRRTFAILSYFHAIFDENENVNNGQVIRWNTELPLCSYRPWEVSLKKGIDKIILTGAGFEDVLPDELHHAINCALVGLVCDEQSSDELDEPYYTQGGSLPSPSYSRCVGLALVRGLDLQKGKLHLLTPLPPKFLQSCRILVKGELEIPVWGMIDFRDKKNNGVAGASWGKVPYLQMGHGEAGVNIIGAAKRRVRRNLMRKNQIPI
ncbi:hypothetical protein Clacol_002029 [Clathrus columnatus]|uniref:Polynucleotide 5'-hydroxyl-kinase GRC3 n=1 Tax=Clathrus columnatus TaxID=1419009 RepID=A0AAV5A4Y0_9AGAM|nr:hypothetical protein Clacol_002029 [Clathrus columnatus]